MKIEATPEAIKRGTRIPRPLDRGAAPRAKSERFYNSDGYKAGGQFEPRWVLKDVHHMRLQAEGAIKITQELKEAEFLALAAKEADQAAEEPARCGATTKAGDPCRNTPLEASEFCATHQPHEGGNLPDEGDGDAS